MMLPQLNKSVDFSHGGLSPPRKRGYAERIASELSLSPDIRQRASLNALYYTPEQRSKSIIKAGRHPDFAEIKIISNGQVLQTKFKGQNPTAFTKFLSKRFEIE